MDAQRLRYLLDQYGNDAATGDERAELQQFLTSGEDANLVQETMAGMMQTVQEPAFDHSDFIHLSQKVVEIDKVRSGESDEESRREPILRRAWFRYAAAAVIVLALGVAGWFYIDQKTIPVVVDQKKLPDSAIAPGKNGAILTLDDGKQLVLDSLGNGVIATQNGMQVALSYGKLVYGDANSPLTTDHSLTYNTMSTPKGRQFQLVLPDGSKVWLNAASSLKYPTAFTGKERVVELNGEAYFEVSKDATKPFRVHFSSPPTGGGGREGAVEVLGTHFNVNAYDNEAAIATTLIEGKVRVHANNDAQVIRPGEQAQVVSGKKIFINVQPNVDQVLAWKNGYFDFNNAELKVMMRQLERWYNIQVVYEGPVPDVVFKGKMDRFVQLADLMRFLKIFGIDARLEERTLIIRGS